MHRRMRIAFSHRMRLLQTDIDACDAMIRHVYACNICKDDNLCADGDVLYEGFTLAQSRAKLLLSDTNVLV